MREDKGKSHNNSSFVKRLDREKSINLYKIPTREFYRIETYTHTHTHTPKQNSKQIRTSTISKKEPHNFNRKVRLHIIQLIVHFLRVRCRWCLFCLAFWLRQFIARHRKIFQGFHERSETGISTASSRRRTRYDVLSQQSLLSFHRSVIASQAQGYGRTRPALHPGHHHWEQNIFVIFVCCFLYIQKTTQTTKPRHNTTTPLDSQPSQNKSICF